MCRFHFKWSEIEIDVTQCSGRALGPYSWEDGRVYYRLLYTNCSGSSVGYCSSRAAVTQRA